MLNTLTKGLFIKVQVVQHSLQRTLQDSKDAYSPVYTIYKFTSSAPHPPISFAGGQRYLEQTIAPNLVSFQRQPSSDKEVATGFSDSVRAQFALQGLRRFLGALTGRKYQQFLKRSPAGLHQTRARGSGSAHSRLLSMLLGILEITVPDSCQYLSVRQFKDQLKRFCGAVNHSHMTFTSGYKCFQASSRHHFFLVLCASPLLQNDSQFCESELARESNNCTVGNPCTCL